MRLRSLHRRRRAQGPRAVAVTRGYLLIADGASEFDKSLSHGEPVSRILALSHADGTRLQSITITNGTVSSLCVGVGKCADLVFAADESQDALRVYKLLSSAPKRAKPASKKYAAVSPEKGRQVRLRRRGAAASRGGRRWDVRCAPSRCSACGARTPSKPLPPRRRILRLGTRSRRLSNERSYGACRD